MPSSRMSRRAAAVRSMAGTSRRIISRWPCSQRVRWVPDAATESGNRLVTRARSQKTGAVPRAPRSMPSFMSSTMDAFASGASRSISQENAMPVPINWHGRPRRRHPAGRTQLRTRHANCARRRDSPASAGASIR